MFLFAVMVSVFLTPLFFLSLNLRILIHNDPFFKSAKGGRFIKSQGDFIF